MGACRPIPSLPPLRTSSPSASGPSATAVATPSASSSGLTVDPVVAVERLSKLGAWGVNFHDNDLVPIDATAAERDRIVGGFKQALKDHGLCVPMATTNLFTDPIFRDGAFTSHDARVRAYALQKTMQAMDLGAEVGASTYVFWGGREGAEVDAAKDPVEAIKRFREALNFLCEYSRDQKYGFRFALEAKPNEPRGDLYFPTTAAYLAFIPTLQYPDMVGVNPEVAHEHMVGLNFYHAIAQALEAGKLFHIDLNDQKFSRFDQDLRFGAESIKANFFVVKLLEDSGYDGPAALRRARLPHRGSGRRVGLRARLHADVPDPQGQGEALPRGQGDSGDSRDPAQTRTASRRCQPTAAAPPTPSRSARSIAPRLPPRGWPTSGWISC